MPALRPGNDIPTRAYVDAVQNMQKQMKTLFPTILIILDIAAAGVYGYQGDIRRFIYWIAAAILTACVTF
jgi:hypothetical protein